MIKCRVLCKHTVRNVSDEETEYYQILWGKSSLLVLLSICEIHNSIGNDIYKEQKETFVKQTLKFKPSFQSWYAVYKSKKLSINSKGLEFGWVAHIEVQAVSIHRVINIAVWVIATATLKKIRY